MNEKQMKKLSRADLLTLLINQSKELEQVRLSLEEAEARLASKEIKISRAGSIAEAALQLNGIFDAAQAASEQYLENVRKLSAEQEANCAQMERECRENISRQLAQTQQQCEEMVAKAKAESQAYWDEVSTKLEAFYRQHIGLRELLAVRTPQRGNENHEE